MRGQVLLPLVVAPLLTLSGGPSGEPVFELAPYPVTTVFSEEGGFSHGQSISIHGKSRYADYLPRTFAAILEATPGVMIQKTAYGQDSPYIRGFTGFRTLLMIDGIRINNSVFRSGPNQYWSLVDPASLERVLVLKGPYAVEYGSDAVGGVVRAFTPERRQSGESTTVIRNAGIRVATAENSVSGRLETRRDNPVQTLLAGWSWRDFGDLEAGGGTGRQTGTGYREAGFDLKWIRDWGPGTLTVCAQGFRQFDVPRTHSTVDGISWRGTVPGSYLKRELDQERSLLYLRYAAKVDHPWMDSLESILSWQRMNETEERIRATGSSDERSFDVDTGALQVKATAAIGPDLRLHYGMEWYRDFVDTARVQADGDTGEERVRIQGPVADDATYDLAGVYGKAFWRLSPRLGATFGMRLTYARAEADRFENPLTGLPSSFRGDWDDFSTSLRLTYSPHATIRFFAGISEGFRAPNLSDLTRLDIARSGELEIPSPDVSPESFLTVEAGISAEKGPLLATLSLYRTDISGMIVRTPTGRILSIGDEDWYEVAKRNAGDGWVHGIEASASLRLADDWLLTAALSWMDSELERFSDTSSDPVRIREPLSRMMPPTGQLSLRYAPSGGKWSLEGRLQAVRRQDDLPESDRRDTQRIPPDGTPGYVRIDCYLNRQVTPDFRLGLGIENVADRDYRVHGSGVNGPGRNLIASVDWRF
jgi:hemoglobin/transferrin/lactoferrin receptor protein